MEPAQQVCRLYSSKLLLNVEHNVLMALVDISMKSVKGLWEHSLPNSIYLYSALLNGAHKEALQKAPNEAQKYR
jgi:hypothetical protein